MQRELFGDGTTKWWTFDQNNSGGSFHFDDEVGIGTWVCIEAESQRQAVDRAEDIGIYFNGCAEGKDCDCCGDRWHKPYRDEGYSFPNKGYGIPVRKPEGDEQPSEGMWGIGYVHPIDAPFYAGFIPDEEDYRKQDGTKA